MMRITYQVPIRGSEEGGNIQHNITVVRYPLPTILNHNNNWAYPERYFRALCNPNPS